MPQEFERSHCPLKLLSRTADKVLPHHREMADLDEQVRRYQACADSEESLLRQQIFFQLSPFLLKSLSWYCHVTSGCGVNCQVAELLSAAYIIFTDLIKKFDPAYHVNFLGYVVNGISWGLFNIYSKERRYHQHRILFSSEVEAISPEKEGGSENEEDMWLTSVMLNRILSQLKQRDRDLFLLHHLFGYSCRDLALLYRTKAKTIQKAIERARKKIRARCSPSPGRTR